MSKARHRMPTTFDHYKPGLAVALGAILTCRGLLSLPMPAEGQSPYHGVVQAAQTLTVQTSARSTAVDYGSGFLGLPGTRRLTGDMATADVALFGDSIARRGTADLTARLADLGKTLATDNQDGRAAQDTVDAVLAAVQLPRIVVMSIGSNNIFEPPYMAAQIARLLAGVPEGTVVLWGDVQVSRWSGTLARQVADQRNSGWVNAQIHDGCTAPCVVVPWAASLASKPTRITAYLQDGVHPWVGPTGPGDSNGTAYWAGVYMSKIGPLL